MKRIIAVIVMCLALQSAWAIDLQSAKEQGLVGEANNGYLAAVKSPASSEVQQLIAEVNAKRKSEFASAADKTGATLQQVSMRFYQLAVQKTQPGHYYQDANGRWVKK